VAVRTERARGAEGIRQVKDGRTRVYELPDGAPAYGRLLVAGPTGDVTAIGEIRTSRSDPTTARTPARDPTTLLWG
jgi:hypothetical protein